MYYINGVSMYKFTKLNMYYNYRDSRCKITKL